MDYYTFDLLSQTKLTKLILKIVSFKKALYFLAFVRLISAVWLGAEKQLELCEKADGKGYAYAENIRNSALKGGNADKVKKTVAEAVDFSYVVDAAKKVK